MRVSFGKRFLESPFARALVGLVSRAWRPLVFGGTRLLVDPRLRRFLRTREPAVFVCWHQDFVMTVGYLSRFTGRRRTHVLASASRDGGLAAASAEAIGFRPAIRGSSAAKGASALRRLGRIVRDPRPTSVAVVADGPRPPARELKVGALHLARESGYPIWLVRTSWWPDRRLERTWARFHLVRPWTAGVVVADGPIDIPSDGKRVGSGGRDELDAMRADVERRLGALADRGDALAMRRAAAP